MKKTSVAIIATLLAAGIGIVAGFYLGANAAEREYGSLSTQSAQRLYLSASMLSSSTGTPKSLEQIAESEVFFANMNSIMAAQLYCEMSPLLQTNAKNDARRLEGVELVVHSRHESGHLARRYIIDAPENSDSCKPFHDPTVQVVYEQGS